MVYLPANEPANYGALSSGQAVSDLTFVSGYSQRRIRITMNPQDNPVQNAGSIAIIDENGNFIFVAGFSSSSFGVPVVIIAPPIDTIGLQIIGVDNTTADLIDLQLPDPSDADALHITQSGSGDAIDIDMGPASTGDAIRIDIATGSTARGIEVTLNNNQPGISVTQSGIGNGIASQSVGRAGVFNSIGNFALSLADFDPAGGIFQRIIEFNGSPVTGPVIVLSDGTDPNGLLTAPIGSLCVMASPTGDLAKNVDGADTWVNL